LSVTRAVPAEVKFLLVDDREENLLALTALLRRDGLTLMTARSGAEALELLLAHDFALAMLDVQMPEMDGFELAELMRGADRSRQVPIIFVTAGASDKARVFRGYESGAVDFLYKPIDPFLLRCKTDTFFALAQQKEQLKAMGQERAEALRTNEMLIAVLGHDLRTPISSIVLAAEMLAKKHGSGAGVDRIIRGAHLMNRMIADLLDFVRVREAGGLPVSPVPMDLLELTQRIVAEHRLTHPTRLIQVSTVGGSLAGSWDEDRLAQLLSNLLGNALKHGKPDSAVQLELDGRASDLVKLSVKNDGAMPAAQRAHLFTPFLGMKSRGGLGLGLYIVQQIARSHGGDATLDAANGDQICFRVTIARKA